MEGTREGTRTAGGCANSRIASGWLQAGFRQSYAGELSGFTGGCSSSKTRVLTEHQDRETLPVEEICWRLKAV